ncbi:MAG: phosphonopyruvate decarboxylase [Suipraeoptans sp.]
MEAEKLLEIIDADFYTGVPDSQLNALCNCLIEKYGTDLKHHVIAANEGNSTAIAAGYHLATNKIPVVYMQNSGEGNAVNPIASLLNEKVYSIPTIFIIGWRGEPGIKDEPQHVFQGEITLELLKLLDIEVFVLSQYSTVAEVECAMVNFSKLLDEGKSVAFVVRKNALNFNKHIEYKNEYQLSREDIINTVVDISEEDPIVSTTGKASRELYEIRETRGQSHKYDFLTVGSMGHSSSIALGIAANKPNQRIWCIDGDGALLMHMGAMALVGTSALKNMIHIVINNGAHETVGGMPTAADKVDLVMIAKGCGYENAIKVEDKKNLIDALRVAKNSNKLCFIEIKCSVGSREDLGRPKTTAIENKRNFMEHLGNIE